MVMVTLKIDKDYILNWALERGLQERGTFYNGSVPLNAPGTKPDGTSVFE